MLPPAVVWPLMDGQTSTRYTVRDVFLKPGDVLELTGIPDLESHWVKSEDPASGASRTSSGAVDTRELAPVDYIELGPNGAVTPQ